MTYIENIFICMSAPILVAMLCAQARYRPAFGFIAVGMGACLLSAYVNAFFTGIYSADIITATVEIAPVVEEMMKLLPLLFYLVIFEPEEKRVRLAILIIAAGFATFENVCYLTQNGASELLFLLIRGFGTGAMHIVCGALIGYGLLYVWKRPWLKIAGTFGLLCAAITYHAIYNLLVSAGGVVQIVGYGIPLFTVIVTIVSWKMHNPLLQ